MNSLCAQSDAGNPLDWFFVYKLAANAEALNKNGPKSSGFEYMYYDESRQKLDLSPHRLGDEKGAIFDTLSQLYGASPAPTTGWIFYNDEKPGPDAKNRSELGHTKGVLAYDTNSDSAFWLVHSTPRYPGKSSPVFTENEKIYAQTFLCITLPDVATAETIAACMRACQEPQVYDFRAPADLKADSPLAALGKEFEANKSGHTRDLHLQSKAGKSFRLLAKDRAWDKDFWIDLVGPKLQVDLNVETWRRGKLPPEADGDNNQGSTNDAKNRKGHDVEDVQFIDLSSLAVPYKWHYTKDHSKWGLSRKNDWIIVADINRQVSQEKRGGGALAFQEAKLWKSLAGVDLLH